MTLNKKRALLFTSLAAVMIISLANSQAFALSSTGNEADVVPNDAIQPSQIGVVDCNVDVEPIVAMVTTNGFSAATATTLVADLQANGFTVREVDITGGNIPECITKLYISTESFGFCLPAPFGVTEIDAVENWVNAGGELWLNGEFAGCGSGTEALLERFVTDANIDFAANGPYVDGVNFDSTVPFTATLFGGVNQYTQFFGSTLVDAAGSPDVVVSDSFGDAMVAGKAGDGCIVITADSNWPHDGFIGTDDNRQLANNIIAFINECSAKPVVGGQLLPIDATALLVAGAQTNAVWILSVLAVIGSVAFSTLYLKTKRN